MIGTIAEVQARLGRGELTSRALLEQCIAAIEDPDGEGARAFIALDKAAARAAADAADALRAAGIVASPLAGIPISIKDLFDVAGQVTSAGSIALRDARPAAAEAPTVARLRAAGAIALGRANMTEFAYSGLGLNPHYGTPGNPRDVSRIPGGSTSGGAVSVGAGMAVATLGTDTGGSIRIPAAFCGLAGFKPTARRVPLAGATPLSANLDSIGPLAASVGCCAIIDAVLANQPIRDLRPARLQGLRLARLTNIVMDGIDDAVANAYDAALSKLSAAGAAIEDLRLEPIERLAEINAAGGFAAADAYAWHRRLLAEKAELYDPRVRGRIERGAAISAADYIDLMAARAAVQADTSAITGQFDAVAMPTVPTVAPKIADLIDDDEAYTTENMRALRNSSIGNFLDRCGVSLPIGPPDGLPVGLMLMGETGADRRLLEIAAAVEAALV